MNDEAKKDPGKKAAKAKLLKAPVKVRTQDAEEEFSDYLLEVDKDRIYIKTDNPYEVGTTIHLRLDLPGDICNARKYAGFPEMPGTEANVSRLYENVLAGYLE